MDVLGLVIAIGVLSNCTLSYGDAFLHMNKPFYTVGFLVSPPAIRDVGELFSIRAHLRATVFLGEVVPNGEARLPAA